MGKSKPETPVANNNEVVKEQQSSSVDKTNTTEVAKPETPVANNNEVVSVAASTQIISSSADNVNVNQGLTKVIIGYPETWEKPKLYTNGDEVFMSAEIAEHFQSIGIAKIVTE